MGLISIKISLKNCLNCAQVFKPSQRSVRFCSRSCGTSYNWKFKEKSTEFAGYPDKKPLKGEFPICGKTVRKRILSTRENKCERCGYDRQVKILQVHHLDRNTGNNAPENLVLLCRNCHAEDHLKQRDGMFAWNKKRN